MTGGIFISYRREDSGPYAGRLHDHLVQHFGRERIFMDLDTLEPGQDFIDVIEEAVGSCDVLVAVIGNRWATVKDKKGRHRLADEEDFIRLEIGTALARNIRVMPVLVGGAKMPSHETLPSELLKLSRRQAFTLHDTRFRDDAAELIRVLDSMYPTQHTLRQLTFQKKKRNRSGK